MLQINFGAVALVTCLGFFVQIVGSHYLNGSVRDNEALVFLMQWGSSLLETLAMAVLFRGMRVHSIVDGLLVSFVFWVCVIVFSCLVAGSHRSWLSLDCNRRGGGGRAFVIGRDGNGRVACL